MDTRACCLPHTTIPLSSPTMSVIEPSGMIAQICHHINIARVLELSTTNGARLDKLKPTTFASAMSEERKPERPKMNLSSGEENSP
ncbi:hypothetical protein Dimus_023126, partial [Dionaea muscipula]